MALHKRGTHWYGDAQADIRPELHRYSSLNGYPAQHFADAKCSCGSRSFQLRLDEAAGVAVRACATCGLVKLIGDGAEYLDEAAPEESECPCGSDVFELSAGVSLYEGTEDVRWFYLGCRCTRCGLTACYGDWKNEYPGFQQLLDQV